MMQVGFSYSSFLSGEYQSGGGGSEGTSEDFRAARRLRMMKKATARAMPMTRQPIAMPTIKAMGEPV